MTGLGEAEARADQVGFLSRVERGRPMVTLKLAASLDGRIATATGESQWITGPEARRHVHAERMRHDAVMVGAGTARADDPSLTVRGLGAKRQPVRVVLSRHLDIPLDSVLARTAKEVPVWLIHGDRAPDGVVAAWEGLGARCIAVPVVLGRIDVAAALAALGQAGLTRVFCEGGGGLAASLLAEGREDSEVRAYSSMAKREVARTLCKVLDDAIQLHGGLGYSNDLSFARWYRWARAARIADGPDEVHQMVIAREFFKNRLELLV